MIVWLKTVHIAALAIWCAGLFGLPGLFARRGRVPASEDRFALQRIARMLFISIASPAAFATIASGTALIFLRPVLEPWFVLKLALVGVLVALHVWTGLVVMNVFLPSGRYAWWRSILASGSVALVVSAILWSVLDKPAITVEGLGPPGLMEPGGLGEVIRSAFHRWRS